MKLKKPANYSIKEILLILVLCTVFVVVGSSAVRVTRDKEHDAQAKTQVNAVLKAIVTNSSDQKGYLQPGLGVANADIKIEGMEAIYSTLQGDGSLPIGTNTVGVAIAAYPDSAKFTKTYDAFAFAVGKALRSGIIKDHDTNIYYGNDTKIGSSKSFTGFTSGNGVAGQALPRWYALTKN